jgi:DNA ligase (NAD+)
VQLDPRGATRLPVETQSELLELLAEWGLPVNRLHQRCADDLDEVEAYVASWSARARARLRDRRRGDQGRPAAAARGAGVVGGREPRWAIAYKFAPTLATTRLSPSRSTWGGRGA